METFPNVVFKNLLHEYNYIPMCTWFEEYNSICVTWFEEVPHCCPLENAVRGSLAVTAARFALRKLQSWRRHIMGNGLGHEIG